MEQKILNRETYQHMEWIADVYSRAAKHVAILEHQNSQHFELNRARAQQDLYSALERGPTTILGLYRKLCKGSNVEFSIGDTTSDQQFTELVDKMHEIVLMPLKQIDMSTLDQTDYRTLSNFVNTNQDNAVQTLTALYCRVQLSSNSQTSHGIRQRAIRDWNLLSGQPENRSTSHSQMLVRSSEKSTGAYQRPLETNSDFDNVACASMEFLGLRTNPFTNYDSDADYSPSSPQVGFESRESNDRVDGSMVPPPLTLKAAQRGQTPARPVRPPRPDERVSFSSSAFSGENDTPATPLSMEFPTSNIANYYADKTRRSLSESYSATDDLRFPMPPPLEASTVARHSRVMSDSVFTDPLTQMSQLLQPAVDSIPPGAFPTSLRKRTYGLPQAWNAKVLKDLPKEDLTIEGARGAVSAIHHLPEVDPKFRPKEPKNAAVDFAVINSAMKKKLDSKAKSKVNLIKVNFCKGALIARKAPGEKAYQIHGRPSGSFGMERYWSCKSCAFEGRAVKVKNAQGKDVPDIDRNVYGSSGILYRWEFLFKSHIKMKSKVKHPVDSPFGCVFCSAEGRGTPIFDGVASLLNHLQEHRSGSISGSAEHATKAILDRSPAVEEDFDIALPPRYI